MFEQREKKRDFPFLFSLFFVFYCIPEKSLS